MSRQNFISKEFFVNASEHEIKQTVLTIPQFVDNIRFLREKTIGPAVKFIYETPGQEVHTYVYVSLLPLNGQQTRVALSVTYTNGQVFGKDSFVSNVLTNFEAAIYAALQGNLAGYQPAKPRASKYEKLLHNRVSFSASINKMIFWKRVFQKRARLLTAPGR
jgi:hypothetical protein